MAHEADDSQPPTAVHKQEKKETHGIWRTDSYSWMRADNWQEVMRNPEALDSGIREHLQAENAWQEEQMADTHSLQDRLFREMKGRIREDDSSIPMKDGEWAYGMMFVTGDEHAKFIRARPSGEEYGVILDGNREAKGHTCFRIGGVTHSPDHRTIAWSFDAKGSEYYVIRFRNPETGTDFGRPIPESGGGGCWTKNSDGFIYCRLDGNHRPLKVFLRNMDDTDKGNENSDDILLYEESDTGFFTNVGKSQSGDWIIVHTHDHQTSEVWLLPADNPRVDLRLVKRREKGVEYSVDEGAGTLYILTNRGNAQDFKIMTAPADDPRVENWSDLVAHIPGRLILQHNVFARHLVRLEREDGLPRIVIRCLSDGEEHAIQFDEEAYSLGLGGAYEFDTDIIRFTYSSMTTPSQTFEYNMQTCERVLLKIQEVPSGHNPDDYVTRRVFAPGHDGEMVPVSLLYRRDIKLDGSAPCLLYGYGAYGFSIPTGFDTRRLSLVDRGFVYAIAHVRGGKEKGFAWYENGRRDKKTNTFRDFISAGEYLITQGFTSRGRIVAQGRSAGGMLMGAVANMAPDLFAGIIGEVPFIDVLNTMLDDTLPLTPPEWPEWGNPIVNREDYEYIASYSPYDQITARSYPPILAVGGLTDPRVTYWEPAKWVAKLREHNTGSAPVLLKTNMEAGHGGASGRFKHLHEEAFSMAFAIKCVDAEYKWKRQCQT